MKKIKKKRRQVLGEGYTRYVVCPNNYDRAQTVRLYVDEIRSELVPLKMQLWNRKARLVLEEL